MAAYNSHMLISIEQSEQNFDREHYKTNCPGYTVDIFDHILNKHLFKQGINEVFNKEQEIRLHCVSRPKVKSVKRVDHLINIFVNTEGLLLVIK